MIKGMQLHENRHSGLTFSFFYPVTGQLLVGQLKDVLWNCEEELELDALL